MRISDWSSDVCSSDLAVDRADRELFEQPLLHHDAAAALVLLGGLEDEGDATIEIARLGEVLGGAQQHRRVAVVTAGVHLALVPRAVVEAVELLDMQGVHIGAQADGRSEERRVGNAWVSTDRSRWSPSSYKKKVYLNFNAPCS